MQKNDDMIVEFQNQFYELVYYLFLFLKGNFEERTK